MASYQQYLKEIRKQIAETDIFDLKSIVDHKNGEAIIDVREHDEYVQGFIPGARWIARGLLEQKIEDAVPDRNKPVILYCASGNRSVLAARSLRELGYTDVKSLSGGFTAWKRAGYQFELPVVLDKEQQIRYSRHTMLPEVGEAGQIRLLKSRVLLLGAGGLGSPIALYLALAGVGTIGIVDFDVVDLSNLQRQILHQNDDIGKPKVQSAVETLNAYNPDVKVITHEEPLHSENAMGIISQYDIIINGADNFAVRYLVNDACVFLKKPLVDGSILLFDGQATVYLPGKGCYRCLYPTPPPPGMVPSCAEAGVLGALCGTIGSIQATEVLKLILGIGDSLNGRLLLYDALSMEMRQVRIRRDPNCVVCGDNPSITALIDYDEFCGTAPAWQE